MPSSDSQPDVCWAERAGALAEPIGRRCVGGKGMSRDERGGGIMAGTRRRALASSHVADSSSRLSTPVSTFWEATLRARARRTPGGILYVQLHLRSSLLILHSFCLLMFSRSSPTMSCIKHQGPPLSKKERERERQKGLFKCLLLHCITVKTAPCPNSLPTTLPLYAISFISLIDISAEWNAKRKQMKDLIGDLFFGLSICLTFKSNFCIDLIPQCFRKLLNDVKIASSVN